MPRYKTAAPCWRRSRIRRARLEGEVDHSGFGSRCTGAFLRFVPSQTPACRKAAAAAVEHRVGHERLSSALALARGGTHTRTRLARTLRSLEFERCVLQAGGKCVVDHVAA